MDFGDALKQVKEGKKACRTGWNGKRMFIYLVSQPLSFKHEQISGNMRRDFNPAIAMCTADGTHCIGWLASQADMLADDWILVPS